MQRLMQIETARLRLRPYRLDDLDGLHACLTQPDVRRYLLDDEIVSRDWVAEEIRGSIDSFARHGFGQWVILPRDGDGLLGFSGYRYFHQPPELQLIYGLLREHWNRGLASEAARAMIRCGFETHGFESVVASTDAPNTASIRVMEKAGLTFAKRVDVDGLDTVYYSLSRDEFEPDAAPYRLRT